VFSQPGPLAGVAPIEQAVAEGALTGQLRGDAEFAGDLASDHGVLVVSEHGLQLLHSPGELGSLRA
jgi:hypothetical protein